ncbi:MAG: DNA methyltransferase [bacterium]|nr:DNA methyltransferase [bacterium]
MGEERVSEQVSLLYVPLGEEDPYPEEDWDYATADTKILTHGFHAYPAMMIPQVARRLIRMYGREGQTLLDPFCGSGTSLVEARLAQLNAYGVDLNPLAVLLARVKATPLPPESLQESLACIYDHYRRLQRLPKEERQKYVPRFFNIDYWFSPQVQEDLALLRSAIWSLQEKLLRDFFLVVFSHTVRECSYTRKGEFKLYRMPPEQQQAYRPDVLATFLAKAEANIAGMAQFVAQARGESWLQVWQGDMRQKQPIPDETVDLIVTSPPYGDSQTTVAYGQFSRLSLQWLGLPDEEAKSIDSRALGGRQAESQALCYRSVTLDETTERIAQLDRRRAKQVRAFYDDFSLCFTEITRVCRQGAKACFVVGNRTVKGVKIPTDAILVEMAEGFGWRLVETFERRIPNKRMPLQNSPSNVPGERGETMTREHIVILEKQG